jgi:ATP-binding cassette subfamily A (ABC1) protein 8
MCVRENITSFIKQHIPDAKLSAESEGKLVYTLPLETTYRFPGNVHEHNEMKFINDIHKIIMVTSITNIY